MHNKVFWLTPFAALLIFLIIRPPVVKAYSYNFSDGFESLTTGNIDGQNGWNIADKTQAEGTWTVATGAGGSSVTKWDPIATDYNFWEKRFSNGVSTLTDQRIQADFNITGTPPQGQEAVGYEPQIWLRQTANTGDAGGYLVYYQGGVWTIGSDAAGSGGTLTTLATGNSPITLGIDTWYTVVVQVINNASGHPVISIYVYPRGGTMPSQPAATATDTANTFQSGYFGFGAVYYPIQYDNVTVSGTDSSALTITSPSRSVYAAPSVATTAVTNSSGKTFYIPYIQTSSTLPVSASISSNVPSGGGVEFVLNQGLANSQTLYSLGGSSPYSVSFTSVPKGTYTLDAYVVDAARGVQAGSRYHDQAVNIGIGDIISAIGDSITAGYPVSYPAVSDWTQAVNAGDPISSDNRNYPQEDLFNSQYESGYAPALNNLLSSYYGYPIFIMNEGVSSYKASDYVTLMATTQWRTRELALAPDRWMINLGVNDANASVTASTYATQMQTIITNLTSTYGAVASNIYLAKPLYIQSNPTASTLEQSYLPQLDSLVQTNSLATGPNFYSYYAPYLSTLYTDSVHPNAAGYTEMASLWDLSFLQPQNVQLTSETSAGTASLTWDSLSSANSQINGYKIFYGSSPGSYTGSVDAGNSLTGDVTGLTVGQTYSFAVAGYYSDPMSATINTTAKSASATATIPAAGGGGIAYSSLLITKTGSGSGTVADDDMSCGPKCFGFVASGKNITLRATPDSSSTFAGWGGACSSSGASPTCTLALTVNTSISATFNLTGSPTSDGTTAPSDPQQQGSSLRKLLVNDGGTFYLISGSSKWGITNPGILASYGYTFGQATPVTSAQSELPTTSNLPPNNGALVKTASDATVYLISGFMRYGFASAEIFQALGYQFSSVLTVTSPELNQLPVATPLTDTTKAHLPGTNIVWNGTVYWIGSDGQLHAYPSLDVYNSWNIANDFSTTVPASSADEALPVGSVEPSRS